MSLEEQLNKDYIQAMKDRDSVRSAALREDTRSRKPDHFVSVHPDAAAPRQIVASAGAGKIADIKAVKRGRCADDIAPAVLNHRPGPGVPDIFSCRATRNDRRKALRGAQRER